MSQLESILVSGGFLLGELGPLSDEATRVVWALLANRTTLQDQLEHTLVTSQQLSATLVRVTAATTAQAKLLQSTSTQLTSAQHALAQEQRATTVLTANLHKAERALQNAGVAISHLKAQQTQDRKRLEQDLSRVLSSAQKLSTAKSNFVVLNPPPARAQPEQKEEKLDEFERMLELLHHTQHALSTQRRANTVLEGQLEQALLTGGGGGPRDFQNDQTPAHSAFLPPRPVAVAVVDAVRLFLTRPELMHLSRLIMKPSFWKSNEQRRCRPFWRKWGILQGLSVKCFEVGM